jgi:hypothetical protein
MITEQAIRGELRSTAFLCPRCDDGQVTLTMVARGTDGLVIPAGEPVDPERTDFELPAPDPCTNGCQIGVEDIEYHVLAGALFERQRLYATFFPNDFCRCDEPPFMHDSP